MLLSYSCPLGEVCLRRNANRLRVYIYKWNNLNCECCNLACEVHLILHKLASMRLQGNTALMSGSDKHIEVAKVLLDAGAEVNASNNLVSDRHCCTNASFFGHCNLVMTGCSTVFSHVTESC